jgi:hypothetical protein
VAVLRILEVIAPVVLVAGAGFLARKLGLDGRRGIHTLALYVVGPPFMFLALYGSDVALADLGRTVLFAIALYAGLAAVALLLGRVLGWERPARLAAVLGMAPTNCGNYGLPILLFGLGDAALPIGVVFVAAHSIGHMLFGLPALSFAAHRGRRPRLAPVLPYILALGLAQLLRSVDATVPTVIERPLALLADAWIPVLLLLLGMELADVNLRLNLGRSAVLGLGKLAIGPLLGLGLVYAFGFEGVWFKALLIQASTPTAVNSLLFAREFDIRPDLVAGTLAVSTLGSILTVSIVLALL